MGWTFSRALLGAARRFGPELRQVCIGALTWTDAGTLRLGDFRRLNAAGSVELVHFFDADLLSWLAQFEVFVIQHWPPRQFIEAIHRANPRLKLLLWVDFESVNDAPRPSELEESYRQMMLGHRWRGTNGEYINAYERQPRAPIWRVDIRPNEVVGDAVGYLQNEVAPYYDGMIHGFLLDNMVPVYFGHATNAPERTNQLFAEHEQAWTNFSNQFRARSLGMFWGNTVAPTDRPGLQPDVQYWEHYFRGRSHLSAYADGVLAGLRSNCVLNVYQNLSGAHWVHPNMPWWLFQLEVVERDLENVYVCTARTGSDHRWFEPKWKNRA